MPSCRQDAGSASAPDVSSREQRGDVGLVLLSCDVEVGRDALWAGESSRPSGVSPGCGAGELEDGESGRGRFAP